MAAQEDPLVIRNGRADKRGQFRVYWKTKVFYLLFRSDQKLHAPICRAYLIGNRSDTRCIKIDVPVVGTMSRRIGSINSGRPSVEGTACASPMSVFSPGNGINDMACNGSDGVSLEFPQTCAGVGHCPVVAGHLGAVATQKDAPVVRDSRAHKRGQFRVYWKECKNIY